MVRSNGPDTGGVAGTHAAASVQLICHDAAGEGRPVLLRVLKGNGGNALKRYEAAEGQGRRKCAPITRLTRSRRNAATKRRDLQLVITLSVNQRDRESCSEPWRQNGMLPVAKYKHSTQKNPRHTLEKHLLPRFGDKAMTEITRQEVQAYVAHRELSSANPLWGAPRIHWELLKLGDRNQRIDGRSPQKFTRRRVPAGSDDVARRDAGWQRRNKQPVRDVRSASPDGWVRPVVQDPTRNVVVHRCSGESTPPRTDRRCRSLSGIIQSRHSRLAVPMKRSQCAFACGARTGVFNTRSDIDQSLVDGGREDAIAIVDEQAIGAIQRRPSRNCWIVHSGGGVAGEIPVHDPACADVEKDEDVELLKGGGHDDEEVAGEYGAGVIVEERRPRLGVGHHCCGAVTACSGAPCAATPSDRASGGAPPQSAPRPQVLIDDAECGGSNPQPCDLAVWSGGLTTSGMGLQQLAGIFLIRPKPQALIGQSSTKPARRACSDSR